MEKEKPHKERWNQPRTNEIISEAPTEAGNNPPEAPTKAGNKSHIVDRTN